MAVSTTFEFQELAEQFKLTEANFKEPVSESHLETISQSSCKHWKSLPAHLNLPTITADDVDQGQVEEKTKRYNFLRQWKEIKGSDATYEQLISALLKIKSKQDAEKICSLLKESIHPPPLRVASNEDAPASTLSTPDTPGDKVVSKEPQLPFSIKSLDEDTRNDLEMQLDTELRNIIRKYSTYVDFITESLQSKGVHTQDICFKLLKESAFNKQEQKRTLLSSHETELQNATSLQDLIKLLYKNYASFLDYDIFQVIVEKYHLDDGQEEFHYPQHLKAYIEKHKISEFIKINPLLKEITDASKEVVLKLDIEATARLADLEKLKTTVARILGIKSAALQLIDLKEGCVEATFLIPTLVGEVVFNKDTVLTEEQKEEFQTLPVRWLKYDGCKLELTTADTQKEPVPSHIAKAASLSYDIDDVATPSSRHKRSQRAERTQYNFIFKPEDDLKCLICLEVARDPQQHVECGKLFCNECLNEYGKDKICPNCRTGGQFYPDKRSKRTIQELRVKCSHTKRGCKWEGAVSTLEKHLPGCTFQGAAVGPTAKDEEYCLECFEIHEKGKTYRYCQRKHYRDKESRVLIETMDTETFCQPSKVTDAFYVFFNMSPLRNAKDLDAFHGKWMAFKYYNEIDGMWEEIRTAIAHGELGGCVSARCTTMCYNPTRQGAGPATAGGVSVYTQEDDIDDIGFRLVEIAKQDIKYKTNEDTRNNVFVHAGSGKVAKKTIYWNQGRPSLELEGEACYATTFTREDIWHLNIVTAPEPLGSKEIDGKWILHLENKELTELWHLLKDLIENPEENFGVIKIVCPQKEVRYSSTEKPKFHIFTSKEDSRLVGENLVELVRTDIDYQSDLTGCRRTLFWNNGKPVPLPDY